MSMGCSRSFGRRFPGISEFLFHLPSFWESNSRSPGWDGEEVSWECLPLVCCGTGKRGWSETDPLPAESWENEKNMENPWQGTAGPHGTHTLLHGQAQTPRVHRPCCSKAIGSCLGTSGANISLPRQPGKLFPLFSLYTSLALLAPPLAVTQSCARGSRRGSGLLDLPWPAQSTHKPARTLPWPAQSTHGPAQYHTSPRSCTQTRIKQK